MAAMDFLEALEAGGLIKTAHGSHKVAQPQ